ncbi:uncharacterized protein Z518_04697 [Rhinocladiella mackenziei CBS 650.93]|uniref:Rhinocladiella mackenziei CBS 650.93 unplaced genomic scaffold supercont1.3, whole genome shotgun sequence n=1 Tax=Rhinocladiella mackenziei CBS 650.93 TaxID=1442369 RepID=A0A0D2IU81_9EURO|nr:uncharacterized protein Z518_04697 [Rhinocladiella mackenziei CBS 650.93]KIX06721.1 hypothetical protein Z518_04697 [Rhinocladiella mackenziei CBS 650.93]
MSKSTVPSGADVQTGSGGNFTAMENEIDTETSVPTGQKRKRYVTQACGECKKRKVRCTGEQPCEQCSTSRLNCEYSTEPRRRNQQHAGVSDSPGEHTSTSSNFVLSGGDAEKFTSEVLNRLHTILTEVRMVKGAIGTSPGPDKLTPLSSSLRGLITPESGEGYGTSVEGQNPDRNVFNGGPSILKPLNTLEKVGNNAGDGGNDDDAANSRSGAKQDCLLSACSNISECYLRELRLWDANIRHQGIHPLREPIDVYFSLMNPHYPCLDEDLFREVFDRYVCNYLLQDVTLDRIQFIALVYLIVAVVKIVKEFCAEDNVVPGWYEFTRAEHLLNHVIRTGKGDLATTQCLILKASYLLYIERHDWAYDVMGTAVRLCFQLGLHNQKSWTGASPFERHMRIRIFWCIYCLERNIAHQCGAPYQINEKDIAVDPPSELPSGSRGFVVSEGSISPIPSQIATIKWARLCSDMWDSMFGVKSQPATAEFIAVTDARILLLLEEVPEPLRWSSETIRKLEYLQYPHYVVRQSIVLHLRANHLRLLLRRSDLLDAKNGGRTAPLCVEIAASSINAMHEYHFSPLKQNTERFPTVSFLSGALVALTAVILGNKVDANTSQKAEAAFQKAIHLLEDMSPGFSLSRRLLRRFQSVIQAATRTMTTAPEDVTSNVGGCIDPTSSRHDPATASNHALFDLELEDLIHFDNFQMMEDESTLSLLNSATAAPIRYLSPPQSSFSNHR